ncbi:MAG: M48 family metallopeptidase [Deltaproteobacteria bacterium]|nr:M48 family metallopeptidase [Deltaproteobacteria bacterium]
MQVCILTVSKTLKFLLSILSIGIVLASCAPTTRYPVVPKEKAQEEAERQRELVVEKTFKMLSALSNVGYRLNVANKDLCTNHSYSAGFVAISLNDISFDFRPAWKKLLSVSEKPTLIHVIPDSPAQRAGLKMGDVILELDDSKTPLTAKDLQKYIEEKGQNSIKMTILRDSGTFHFIIHPEKVCRINTQLVFSEQVNAFTDGKTVFVTTAMMNFVKDENELALVVGHEMAHCLMGHITKRIGNMILGTILGGIVTGITGINVVDLGSQVGAQMFSQEFEAEADYVGCYLAYKAGYTLSGAEELWRRMATFHPGAINLLGSTHPSTASRYVAIKKAYEEIREKELKGLPLVPEKR